MAEDCVLVITSTVSGGTAVIVLSGEIDLAEAHRLADYLRGFARPEVDDVIVDMAAVSFVDVVGLRCLESATRSLSWAGRPMVCRDLARQPARLVVQVRGGARIVWADSLVADSRARRDPVVVDLRGPIGGPAGAAEVVTPAGPPA
ncbi:MAG: anti-sigma factor antagonist [Actinomycetota bacterium]|nr:MAG: anti-sigma factor antagonist [Actinomycetota bacterium]